VGVNIGGVKHWDSVRRWAPFVLAVVTLMLFAWNVVEFYFLGDDCYISFRYARHFAEGNGLRWNLGERPVEGYTNFLWVLLMAAGMVGKISPEYLANILGIASGVAVLGFTLWFSASHHSWRDPFIWAAPLLLASSRSFGAWCTGGLETQFFAMLVFGGYVVFCWERTRKVPLPWLSAVIFALACLTRPEGATFAAIAFGAHALEVVLKRRSAKGLLVWTAILVAISGSHLCWRKYYYGLWLPNTFHAKVNGLWVEQGLSYFNLFNTDYWFFCYAWLMAVPLFLQRRFEHALLFIAVSVHLAFLLYVGGDRFEFRFLVHVFPLMYWLLTCGMRRLDRSWKGASWVALAIVLGITLWGRQEPEARIRDQVASLHQIKAHAAGRKEQGQLLRNLVLSGDLPQDLRISVRGAGALPYFSRLHTLDYLGLSDARVAAGDITERTVIGHEKHARPGYLARKHVAMFDTNRAIVFKAKDNPKKEVQQARSEVKKLHKEALQAREAKRQKVEAKNHLQAKCLFFDPYYLVFATALPEDEFGKVFGGAKPCEFN
jgi:arabinofuranosyltransferase